MRIVFTLAVVLAFATFCSATVIDDFNRPDAGDLGPNWTNVSGGLAIAGNQAIAPGASQTTNLAIYNGLNLTSAYLDVFSVGEGLQYAALVVAFQDAGNNFFVKVQSQDGVEGFEHYAFYYGNNGSGYFTTLNAPFTSGRITVSYVGLQAFLDIDTDFDSVPDQQYSYTYGNATGGSGAGIGIWGANTVDNFGGGAYTPEVPDTGIPEPGTWAMMLAGIGALLVVRFRR